MDNTLNEKVDLMAANFQTLKAAFPWESNLVKHFGAMVHASNEKQVDANLAEEIKNHIKDETGWISQFRGTNGFILTNLLCLESDYKLRFSQTQEVFERMRNAGFSNSAYLPLAAYCIAKEVEALDWDAAISRMDSFYGMMKENHFWLTSQDDYVFAAVLGATGLDVDDTSQKIEACYRQLNQKGLHRGNELQSLSHVLALGDGSVEEKCGRAMDLFERLNREGCKLRYQGLATLGVLSLLPEDTEKLTSEVKAVYDDLYGRDGYGFWSLDTSMRSILASTLVADIYVDGMRKGILQTTLGNSINAITIAQQHAAVAAACAASASAAASAGS